MKNEIRKILEKAIALKEVGTSTKQLSQFIFSELGKLIVYDNNYTSKNESFDLENNNEGKISELSVNRQKRLLEKSTDLSKFQICKGMAEIYVAILSELEIEAKVVGVESKEDVDGENEKSVPEMYKVHFDNDMQIVRGKNEKDGNLESKHYYALVLTEDDEYIADFLTEAALTRIKIGEAFFNETLPGFHKKVEHQSRTLENRINISPLYKSLLQEEFFKYMKENKDTTKAFEFVFNKLQKNIKNFGFEESKDYILLLVSTSFPKQFLGQLPIPINFVKEDEEKSDVICIYRLGEKNYLIRSGQNESEFPIGEVSDGIIEKLLNAGFLPRKLSDAKKIRDIKIENYKNRSADKRITIESLIRNAVGTQCIGQDEVRQANNIELKILEQKNAKERVTLDE